MPRIPQYRRQQVPSTNVGAAPRSVRASRTREEVVGGAVADLGRAMQGSAAKLQEQKLQLDAQKERLNDINLELLDYKEFWDGKNNNTGIHRFVFKGI